MVHALATGGREDTFTVRDVPQADPGPGQVRVAVEAASLNGIDAKVAAGYLWDMLPHTFPDKLASLLSLVDSGALRVPVAHIYELDRAPDALADFNRHKLGKLVVAVG